MSKEPIKYKSLIHRLWFDPVLSKIISAAIISLSVFFYSLSQAIFKNISFYQILKETINYKIEIWKIFIWTFVVLIFYSIYYKIKQNRNIKIGKFNTEEIIGNFTFRELHNSLLTNRIDLPVSLQSNEYAKHLDLTTLFVLFQRKLNIGINWNELGDQGFFLYYVLAPTLMSYGLTEKTPEKNSTDMLGIDNIQTSEIGYKYLSSVEKWRIYNNENITDTIIEAKLLKSDENSFAIKKGKKL